MELDIDFENFTVDAERKTTVKSFVEIVKAEPWVHDLKTLIAEHGVAVEDSKDEPNTLFGKLDTSKNSKVFKVDTLTDGTAHPAQGILVESDGTILKLSFESDCLLEVSFLPKGSEFAVYFIDEAKFELLREKIALLNDFVKEAKTKKSARAATWKARFES